MKYVLLAMGVGWCVGCGMPVSRDVVFATQPTGSNTPSTPASTAGGNTLIHATGFARRVGTPLQAVLRDATGAPLGAPVSLTIAADAFDVSLPGTGATSVAVLVDVNRNGHCDPAPRDGGWVLPLQGNTLTLDANTTQSDVCGAFPITAYNLWVNGDSDHEGRNVRGALVDDQNHVVATGDTVVLNSSYTFAWPARLAPGKTYTAYWFIDLVQSGVCELFPADFVYTQTIAAVSDDVALVVRGDDRVRTDLCTYLGHYAATLTIAGLGNYANKRLHAQIFDQQAAYPVDGTHSQTLSAASAQVQWPGLLNAGRTYDVAVFIDANGNSQCDNTDPQWVVTVANPQAAIVSSIDATTTATASACARFPGSVP